jgi:hypothetical protein
VGVLDGEVYTTPESGTAQGSGRATAKTSRTIPATLLHLLGLDHTQLGNVPLK